MELSIKGISDKNAWESRGYVLPQFDLEAMRRETAANPAWIHFGAGNIFRAYHCVLAQKLLEAGEMKSGIVVAEGFDYEIIEKAYRCYDNLSVLAILKGNGSIEKQVIGSVADSLLLDSDKAEEYDALRKIFENKSLQLCTFTITEKGYNLYGRDGAYAPAVAEDMKNGPEKPQSYIGKVASLLYARYCAGAAPIAMVSTDNCSHNGEKLFGAIDAFAKGWEENGTVKAGFAAYVEDPKQVSFPWSMIDKITPRPDASVEEMLAADGLQNADPVITSRNTYVAPFVNAEESEYLVVEDAFPNGRPALEKAGVIFTDRDTVNRVERMKVTTCLNPLHTALAIYGCLLGYERISDEMKDADLLKLIQTVGYQEGLPVVTDPGVLSPQEFIDTVVQVRLPNPFMPDTPQRIATDTSQKLPIRFGETIKSYAAQPSGAASLKAIPLVLAGWLRYLLAIDDNGQAFDCSSDPLLDEMQQALTEVKKNFTQEVSTSRENMKELITPILQRKDLFGVDLTEVGLSDAVIDDFLMELEGKGAVRKTLQKVLG